VRYATPAAFRTALEQRLLTTARGAGIPVVRLRKLIVFDRLMARLLVVARDRWILKGAVALHLRLGVRFRTTRDMDLARYDNEQAATADFLAAQALDLGDYFQFDIRKTARLDAVLEGAAVRYHVAAEIAGRPFEEVTVDVSLGDPHEAARQALHRDIHGARERCRPTSDGLRSEPNLPTEEQRTARQLPVPPHRARRAHHDIVPPQLLSDLPVALCDALVQPVESHDFESIGRGNRRVTRWG
jgi:hypothetical protein